MPITELGHAAVSSGWRKKVADVVTPPVADRTPPSERHVRAAIGIVLFAISVAYVVKTLRAAVADSRG